MYVCMCVCVCVCAVRGATEKMERSNPNTRTSAGNKNKNIQHRGGLRNKRQEDKTFLLGLFQTLRQELHTYVQGQMIGLQNPMLAPGRQMMEVQQRVALQQLATRCLKSLFFFLSSYNLFYHTCFCYILSLVYFLVMYLV